MSTHHCLPRDAEDLKDLSAQPHIPQMGTPSFRDGKYRRQKFVLIPFIVLHSSLSPDFMFRQNWAGLRC